MWEKVFWLIKSSSIITSGIGANHATNISDDILSTELQDSSTDVATELNPAEPTPPTEKATRGLNVWNNYTAEFQAFAQDKLNIDMVWANPSFLGG